MDLPTLNFISLQYTLKRVIFNINIHTKMFNNTRDRHHILAVVYAYTATIRV